jgi:hypothetical protein
VGRRFNPKPALVNGECTRLPSTDAFVERLLPLVTAFSGQKPALPTNIVKDPLGGGERKV